MAVHLKNVTLAYSNGVEGLSNLSLRIRDGEFCFITGPSGSGKSTLSKILTGELAPTAGKVKVNGFLMKDLGSKEKAEARRTIGMVFQDFRLIQSMTVEENLEFAMRCVGASMGSIAPRLEEVMELVSIGGKGDRLPSELSGGEQQRVAIARAIINRPALIIADEPTGNLDPSLADDIMDLFVKINRLGTTTIIITHAKELVDRRMERVIALSGGKLVRDSVGMYRELPGEGGDKPAGQSRQRKGNG